MAYRDLGWSGGRLAQNGNGPYTGLVADSGRLQTRESVEAALIEMYRRLPGCPVFSAGPTSLSVWGADAAIREPLMWGRRFIFEDTFGRQALATWARCKATRSSFGEQCRELKWSRSTAEDARRRAADAIAAGLNATP